jgi:predicted MFS family arabinose efflux permease
MIRRQAALLGASVFGLSLGIFSHLAMNVNFLHEVLHATAWQQGYLESIRETCGILSFFVILLLVGRSEPRVSAVMLAMTGLGLAAYSRVDTIPGLIACSLFWSFGFHAWVPISGSMQLALARKGETGRLLGTLGAVGAAGVLTGLGLVWGLKSFAGFEMRGLFLLCGGLTAAGAIPLLFMRDLRVRREDAAPRFFPRTRKRPSGFFAPKFRLYGLLEMLDGMSKQIFFLFATLALVREHGVQAQTIAALMFANQVLLLGLAPLAGRLTDRIGERPVLTAYFAGQVLVFALYASIQNVPALCAVYMLDSAFRVLRIGLPVYARRLAGAGHRTRLLAMGVTMNHVGAVSLPLIGGALYATYGYRLPFLAGGVFSLLAIAASRRLPARAVV